MPAPVFTLLPHPAAARFVMPGFHTWCGTVTRDPQDVFHLFASAWPEASGHNGWVTHSMIVHATADTPLGLFTYQNVALGPRTDTHAWDRDVAHNPTILHADGKWYLYYTGNFGDGDYWTHRNNQRVGVAESDHPGAPFVRRDAPLLMPGAKGAWDDVLTTNPSCTQMPDGRFVMIYKAVSSEKAAPFYGPVRHGVAFADSPTGPFVKHPEPIFQSTDAFFAAEDPFVWSDGKRLFCILKDMGKNFSAHDRALVLFTSDDALDWRLADTPVVTTRRIVADDGAATEYNRLERPQLYFENGTPSVLYVAAKPREDADESFNLHIPVVFAD